MKEASGLFYRRSIRIKGYDYSQPGAYFITIVANDHKCIFGKITAKGMNLYDLGKIIQRCWFEIPNHFLFVDVEPFVVMPNHVHGIITINEHVRRGTIYRAPTTNNRALANTHASAADHPNANIEKFGKPVDGSIPTIIRTFKAAVSRLAKREFRTVNIWQRNYYEHIIRHQSELENIALYISSNTTSWADDPEYIP